MAGPFDDIPPDIFADIPAEPKTRAEVRAEQRARGWQFNPFTLGKQVAAGLLTTPTDVTAGLYGAVTGNEAATNLAQGVSDAVNEQLGVIDPNWWDNTPEFIARTAGGAIVGAPPRLASWLARTTGLARISNAPATRVLEAFTPFTLPVTPRNVIANTAGGAIVGGALQEVQDIAARDDASQNAVAMFADIPAGERSGLFDDIAPQERTTAQRLRDYAPLIALGAAGTAGGVAALRQMRINREVAQAREAAAVPAQPATATTPAQPEVAGGLVNPDAVAGNLKAVRQESSGERFVRNVVDDTATARARIQQAADAGLIRQDIADEVNAGFGTSVSQAPLQERTNEMLRQGDAFGIRIEPSTDYEIRRIALQRDNASEFALYNNARAAQNELDDRRWYANNDQPQARRMLSDRSTDDLKRIVDAAEANPRVRELLDADSKDNLARLNFSVQEGLITQQDAIKMRNVRPGYLHSMVPDNTPLTRRNMAENQIPQQVPDPIAARQDAWSDVISRAIENRQRRALYDAAQMINTRNPNSLRDLGIGRVGPVDWVRKNVTQGAEVLPVRINGQTFGIELAPEVASGARTMARATAGWFGGMTQVYRNLTTGTGATLFGAFQAPTSAAYGTWLVGITRPRGTYGGYIDRALGGRLPFFDPTFPIAVGSSIVRDIAAETARAVSSQLMRSMYMKGNLAGALRMAGVDPQMLRTKLNGLYETSLLAERRRQGSTGTGLMYDPRAAEMQKLADIAATPEYSRMQSADKRERGVAAMVEQARAVGRATTPASAERAWRLFSSYLNIISDSPVAGFVLLNRGRMNEATLHGTARRLQGDPALRGASRATQIATAVMPYSNIGIQATAQLGSAARQQPFRVAGSLAYIGTIGAAITVYSALMADEEEGGNRHMQALLNATPDRLMNGIQISMAGVDPTTPVRIPVDPLVAFPMGLGTIALSHVLARADMMPGLGDAFGEFLNDRYVPFLIGGGSRALNPLNAPPGLNAVVQSLGGPDISNAFDVINPRFGNTPRDPGAPGYSDRRFERDPISRTVDLFMTDLFGLSGEAALSMMRDVGYGGDVTTAAERTFTAGLARNPGVAPLFGFTRAMPQRSMIAEQLGPLESNASKIAGSFFENTLRAGVIGTGRQIEANPNPLGGDRTDPSVVGLAMQVKDLYNRRDIALQRRERDKARDAIINIRSQSADPSSINEQTNAYVARINAANEYILREYRAFERRVQRDTGRDFDISRFDPLRPIDQFPRRGE